jgi:hypothetical protein
MGMCMSSPLFFRSSLVGHRAKRVLWLALAISLSSAASAAPESKCELHVWPAQETGANNGGWMSNLGIAGAIADYEQNKDANLRDQVALIEGLTPIVQAKLLADADLPTLLGLPDAKLVFQARPLPARAIAKDKARQSRSTAACYAELIVARNFYQKSAVYGRTLASQFTFKDFRGNSAKPRMKSASARNPVSHFPPERPEDADRARQGLAEAFAANVRAFAKKVRR